MSSERPRLDNFWNYYKGRQNILQKHASDVGKPCNRIVANYCSNIVQNYKGYIIGVPVAYSSEHDISAISEILNYNDEDSENSELLKDALIFGSAYEVNYIDEDKKQRFKRLDPRECIPIYDTTINQELLYVIRFFNVDTVDSELDKYIIEVYGASSIRTYQGANGFTTISLLEERPHFFNQVPITVFQLNNDGTNIFENIMTLQDAYNSLQSSEVDDFESFCDAYLILKGLTADEEDLKQMKENRVLLLDTDSEATYLTKSISDTQIENMLQRINDTIHKISNSPDFNDEKLMAQSGIAMRYKLIGFENVSAGIVNQMTKALQKRIELICSILSLKGEEVWRDINIIFTRNLPVNTLELAEMANKLRGLVSDRTLLANLPIVPDVDAELEQLQAEKLANMSMFKFGVNNDAE